MCVLVVYSIQNFFFFFLVLVVYSIKKKCSCCIFTSIILSQNLNFYIKSCDCHLMKILEYWWYLITGFNQKHPVIPFCIVLKWDELLMTNHRHLGSIPSIIKLFFFFKANETSLFSLLLARASTFIFIIFWRKYCLACEDR